MQNDFINGHNNTWGNRTLAQSWFGLLIAVYGFAAQVFGLDLRVQADPTRDIAELRWYPCCARPAASFEIDCYAADGERIYTSVALPYQTALTLSNVWVRGIAVVCVKALSADGKVLSSSAREAINTSISSHSKARYDMAFKRERLKSLSRDAQPFNTGILGPTANYRGTADKSKASGLGESWANSESADGPRPINQMPKADVVFLVDASGSMASRLNAVYTNMLLFSDALQLAGIDFQLGVVVFGQSSDDGAPQIIGDGLTPDKQQFAEWIAPLNDWTDWGGNEPGFEAIRLAIQTYFFRPNANKAFILITDEDSDDLDKTNTIELILSNNVIVHVAADCTYAESASHYCDETSVRGVSGGILIQPIEGPYDDVIFTITGTPPIIRTQPASQTNSFGSTATLNVLAIGSVPLSYQWRKGNTNLADGDRITGAQTASLVISNLYGGDAGVYTVVVSNSYGSVTSEVAVLTVTDPLVTNLPTEVTLNAGQSLQLTVEAIGTLPLSYQWRKNGTDLTNSGRITGATNHTLTVVNCYGVDAGEYSVVVSNWFNCITNSIAVVKVLDPAILANPTNQNRNVGQTATFNVVAVGTTPLAYRWFKDDTQLIGATNATLVITNVQLEHAGGYVAVVTNTFGAVTSAVATLVVNMTQPDPSFNPGANNSVHAFALQPDGKIIVGGEFTQLAGQSRTQLGRLFADGTVDLAFCPVISGLGDTTVNCIALLPDGKILIGGYFDQIDGYSRTNIAQLNPDGTCDTTFMLGANKPVNCFALQPDGKILVGGWFDKFGGLTRSNLARLNPDGTLDTNFEPAIAGDESATVYSLAVQLDGKIIVAGRFASVNGQSRTNIARLNPDGSLDQSFAAVVGNEYAFVQSALVQPDGKIVLAGCFDAIWDEIRESIGRLNSDGTLDTNFNPGTECTVDALALQTDGKMLVAGSFTRLGGGARSCIGRLYANGTLDPSFIPEVGVLYSAVHALALQADGNVLAGGRFDTLGGVNRANLARLLNTPAATHSLNFTGTTLRWLRSSASPEVCWTLFEYSTNGTDWISLGVPTRIANGWELAGVQIRTCGAVRARGCTVGGKFNGSTWFTEDKLVGPVIFAGPTSSTNVLGTTATFSVVAVGMLPMHFQWRKDSIPIPGATNATLALHNIQTNQAGYYSVIVSNSYGCVTSAVAQLVVVYPTTNFANSTPIQIALGTNRALPYPSQILVEGLMGTIDGVRVTLSNLTHSAPADLDIVLVGPQGQKIMLMSDAGGTVPITNVTLHFTMVATNVLPWTGQIVPGYYKPTDYPPPDAMPSPAPTGPYTTNLAVLAGTNPNGAWSLYVADDNPDHYVGVIQGGWALTIRTAPVPPPIIHTADASFGFINGLFGFNLSGPAGWRVIVQGSTNLLDWTPVGTNWLGTSPVYFSDPESSVYNQRFYRAVIVP